MTCLLKKSSFIVASNHFRLEFFWVCLRRSKSAQFAPAYFLPQISLSSAMTELGPRGSRGPAFTSFQDFLICKAFMASSEDPTVGAYQRCSSFQMTMHRNFCQFLEDHEKISLSLFEAVPSGDNQVPSTFHRPYTKGHLWLLQACHISKGDEVYCYHWSYHTRVAKQWRRILWAVQTTFGDFEPFKKCYEFLENKRKFENWRGHITNAANNNKK